MEPDLWERGGQHSESKLGEVVIEGECQADLKSLHYRETDGISEGEVFIGIPSEDALSALLVALPHTHDDSLALPHVMQELQSECRPRVERISECASTSNVLVVNLRYPRSASAVTISVAALWYASFRSNKAR